MIARFYTKLRGDTIDFVEHRTGNWVEYEDHQQALKEAYEKGKNEEHVRATAAKWGREKY